MFWELNFPYLYDWACNTFIQGGYSEDFKQVDKNESEDISALYFFYFR